MEKQKSSASKYQISDNNENRDTDIQLLTTEKRETKTLYTEENKEKFNSIKIKKTSNCLVNNDDTTKNKVCYDFSNEFSPQRVYDTNNLKKTGTFNPSSRKKANTTITKRNASNNNLISNEKLVDVNNSPKSVKSILNLKSNKDTTNAHTNCYKYSKTNITSNLIYQNKLLNDNILFLLINNIISTNSYLNNTNLNSKNTEINNNNNNSNKSNKTLFFTNIFILRSIKEFITNDLNLYLQVLLFLTCLLQLTFRALIITKQDESYFTLILMLQLAFILCSFIIFIILKNFHHSDFKYFFIEKILFAVNCFYISTVIFLYPSLTGNLVFEQTLLGALIVFSYFQGFSSCLLSAEGVINCNQSNNNVKYNNSCSDGIILSKSSFFNSKNDIESKTNCDICFRGKHLVFTTYIWNCIVILFVFLVGILNKNHHLIKSTSDISEIKYYINNEANRLDSNMETYSISLSRKTYSNKNKRNSNTMTNNFNRFLQSIDDENSNSDSIISIDLNNIFDAEYLFYNDNINKFIIKQYLDNLNTTISSTSYTSTQEKYDKAGSYSFSIYWFYFNLVFYLILNTTCLLFFYRVRFKVFEVVLNSIRLLISLTSIIEDNGINLNDYYGEYSYYGAKVDNEININDSDIKISNYTNNGERSFSNNVIKRKNLLKKSNNSNISKTDCNKININQLNSKFPIYCFNENDSVMGYNMITSSKIAKEILEQIGVNRIVFSTTLEFSFSSNDTTKYNNYIDNDIPNKAKSVIHNSKNNLNKLLSNSYSGFKKSSLLNFQISKVVELSECLRNDVNKIDDSMMIYSNYGNNNNIINTGNTYNTKNSKNSKNTKTWNINNINYTNVKDNRDIREKSLISNSNNISLFNSIFDVSNNNYHKKTTPDNSSPTKFNVNLKDLFNNSSNNTQIHNSLGFGNSRNSNTSNKINSRFKRTQSFANKSVKYSHLINDDKENFNIINSDRFSCNNTLNRINLNNRTNINTINYLNNKRTLLNNYNSKLYSNSHSKADNNDNNINRKGREELYSNNLQNNFLLKYLNNKTSSNIYNNNNNNDNKNAKINDNSNNRKNFNKNYSRSNNPSSGDDSSVGENTKILSKRSLTKTVSSKINQKKFLISTPINNFTQYNTNNLNNKISNINKKNENRIYINKVTDISNSYNDKINYINNNANENKFNSINKSIVNKFLSPQNNEDNNTMIRQVNNRNISENSFNTTNNNNNTNNISKKNANAVDLKLNNQDSNEKDLKKDSTIPPTYTNKHTPNSFYKNIDINNNLTNTLNIQNNSYFSFNNPTTIKSLKLLLNNYLNDKQESIFTVISELLANNSSQFISLSENQNPEKYLIYNLGLFIYLENKISYHAYLTVFLVSNNYDNPNNNVNKNIDEDGNINSNSNSLKLKFLFKIYLVAISQDFKEEEKIKAEQKYKSKLLAKIAHEFKTPCNNIMFLVSQLQDRVVEVEDLTSELHDMINSNNEKIDELSNEVGVTSTGFSNNNNYNIDSNSKENNIDDETNSSLQTKFLSNMNFNSGNLSIYKKEKKASTSTNPILSFNNINTNDINTYNINYLTPIYTPNQLFTKPLKHQSSNVIENTELKNIIISSLAQENNIFLPLSIRLSEFLSEQNEISNKIKSLTDYTIYQINDLINYANNYDFAKIKIEMQETDLEELIFSVFDILSSLIQCYDNKQNKIIPQLILEKGIEKEKVFSDEVLLKQLLLNIVNNAIKYTKSGYIRIIISYDNCFGSNENIVDVGSYSDKLCCVEDEDNISNANRKIFSNVNNNLNINNNRSIRHSHCNSYNVKQSNNYKVVGDIKSSINECDEDDNNSKNNNHHNHQNNQNHNDYNYCVRNSNNNDNACLQMNNNSCRELVQKRKDTALSLVNSSKKYEPYSVIMEKEDECSHYTYFSNNITQNFMPKKAKKLRPISKSINIGSSSNINKNSCNSDISESKEPSKEFSKSNNNKINNLNNNNTSACFELSKININNNLLDTSKKNSKVSVNIESNSYNNNNANNNKFTETIIEEDDKSTIYINQNKAQYIKNIDDSDYNENNDNKSLKKLNSNAIKIRIQDTGIGINDEELLILKQLFEVKSNNYKKRSSKKTLSNLKQNNISSNTINNSNNNKKKNYLNYYVSVINNNNSPNFLNNDNNKNAILKPGLLKSIMNGKGNLNVNEDYNSKGTGLGLYASKLLCEILYINFEFNSNKNFSNISKNNNNLNNSIYNISEEGMCFEFTLPTKDFIMIQKKKDSNLNSLNNVNNTNNTSNVVNANMTNNANNVNKINNSNFNTIKTFSSNNNSNPVKTLNKNNREKILSVNNIIKTSPFHNTSNYNSINNINYTINTKNNDTLTSPYIMSSSSSRKRNLLNFKNLQQQNKDLLNSISSKTKLNFLKNNSISNNNTTSHKISYLDSILTSKARLNKKHVTILGTTGLENGVSKELINNANNVISIANMNCLNNLGVSHKKTTSINRNNHVNLTNLNNIASLNNLTNHQQKILPFYSTLNKNSKNNSNNTLNKNNKGNNSNLNKNIISINHTNSNDIINNKFNNNNSSNINLVNNNNIIYSEKFKSSSYKTNINNYNTIKKFNKFLEYEQSNQSNNSENENNEKQLKSSNINKNNTNVNSNVSNAYLNQIIKEEEDFKYSNTCKTENRNITSVENSNKNSSYLTKVLNSNEILHNNSEFDFSLIKINEINKISDAISNDMENKNNSSSYYLHTGKLNVVVETSKDLLVIGDDNNEKNNDRNKVSSGGEFSYTDIKNKEFNLSKSKRKDYCYDCNHLIMNSRISLKDNENKAYRLCSNKKNYNDNILKLKESIIVDNDKFDTENKSNLSSDDRKIKESHDNKDINDSTIDYNMLNYNPKKRINYGNDEASSPAVKDLYRRKTSVKFKEESLAHSNIRNTYSIEKQNRKYSINHNSNNLQDKNKLASDSKRANRTNKILKATIKKNNYESDQYSINKNNKNTSNPITNTKIKLKPDNNTNINLLASNNYLKKESDNSKSSAIHIPSFTKELSLPVKNMMKLNLENINNSSILSFPSSIKKNNYIENFNIKNLNLNSKENENNNTSNEFITYSSSNSETIKISKNENYFSNNQENLNFDDYYINSSNKLSKQKKKLKALNRNNTANNYTNNRKQMLKLKSFEYINKNNNTINNNINDDDGNNNLIKPTTKTSNNDTYKELKYEQGDLGISLNKKNSRKHLSNLFKLNIIDSDNNYVPSNKYLSENLKPRAITFNSNSKNRNLIFNNTNDNKIKEEELYLDNNTITSNPDSESSLENYIKVGKYKYKYKESKDTYESKNTKIKESNEQKNNRIFPYNSNFNKDDKDKRASDIRVNKSSTHREYSNNKNKDKNSISKYNASDKRIQSYNKKKNFITIYSNTQASSSTNDIRNNMLYNNYHNSKIQQRNSKIKPFFKKRDSRVIPRHFSNKNIIENINYNNNISNIKNNNIVNIPLTSRSSVNYNNLNINNNSNTITNNMNSISKNKFRLNNNINTQISSNFNSYSNFNNLNNQNNLNNLNSANNANLSQINNYSLAFSKVEIEDNIIKIIITDDSIMIRTTMINLLKKAVKNKIIIKSNSSNAGNTGNTSNNVNNYFGTNFTPSIFSPSNKLAVNYPSNNNNSKNTNDMKFIPARNYTDTYLSDNNNNSIKISNKNTKTEDLSSNLNNNLSQNNIISHKRKNSNMIEFRNKLAPLTNISNNLNTQIPNLPNLPNTSRSKNKNNQSIVNNTLMNVFNESKDNDTYPCIEILECSDGIETLKNVIEDQGKDLIKLIFTDENMEFMSGSESARIINKMIKDKKIKNIPIISFTCFEDKDTKKKILDSGVSVILSKPVSSGKLKDTLKQYIGPYVLIN